MRMSKKIIAAVLLINAALLTNVFADDADHSKILPDFSNISFDLRNLSFGVEGNFAFPVGFTGEQKLAGKGFGSAVKAGYDWDGWLCGLNFEYKYNDRGGWMSYMDNFFINLEISKIFGRGIIPFMPEFLDLRVSAGIGIDIIHTTYYPNSYYKTYGIMVSDSFITAAYGLGLDIEYNAFEYVVPYLGFNCKFTGDKSGLMVHPEVHVGARTTIGRIEGPEDTGNPKLRIKASPAIFTPDGDGKADELKLKIKTKYEKGAEPKSWKVEFVEENGSVIKTYSGEGKPPASIVWNGESDKKNFSHTSAAEYKAIATVEDSLGNVNVKEVPVNVGILVEKLDDGSLRILVNSIKFDANKATFDSLTAREKRGNDEAIKLIANALQKYKQYRIIIEGHAHNVSGTEEEEFEELLPLSKARAEAIMAILIEEGVSASKMTAVGKGGSEPISTEPRRNRRVEFKLVNN